MILGLWVEGFGRHTETKSTANPVASSSRLPIENLPGYAGSAVVSGL